jgi:diguanylate cyclase (GGDEF)-like protein/PAS domain S-box-containing protein
VLVTLATVFVQYFERSSFDVNLIWIANGLLLAYLLLAPRWRWPGYLAAGASAMVVGSMIIGEPWRMILLYNVLNLVEVMVGALLLRGKSTVLPRFTQRRYLIRFIAVVMLAAPVTTALILLAALTVFHQPATLRAFLNWVIGDGLGGAITIPTFVAIFQTRFRGSAALRRHWLYPAALAMVSVAAFSQTRMPLVILVFPFLVLLLMRLGLGWAALATLFVAATASWYTIRGAGPFVGSGSMTPLPASIQLQFFVAVCILMIYIVSVVLEDQKAAERRLQEIASLHALVTDNSRDMIVLADLDGKRTYVSPAVETIAGWKPEDLTGRNLAEWAHPGDQPKIVEALRQLRQGTEGVMIEYQVRKFNGEYLWIEASLRVYRDRKTGIRAGILSLARDISLRKHNESLLLRAYQELEQLAVVDPLTNVANRRRFDECLASEWSRAVRLKKPLSLILFDADFFKEFNDSFGHLRGDECLKQIAEAAAQAVTRPGDLVARFGGDEFAVILSDTSGPGAADVSSRIAEAVLRRRIGHAGNSAGFVTISAGCATAVPEPGESATTLIQAADDALYRAKRNGRNQVCNVLALSESEVGERLV